MQKLLKKLIRDENGGETIEYALVAGLIVAGCVAIIGQYGTKVFARWNSVNSKI